MMHFGFPSLPQSRSLSDIFHAESSHQRYCQMPFFLFPIVYCEMLRTCRYSILLYTTDICGCHFSCQIRIFREIFKISSAERISFHVKSRSKQNIYSKSRCFFSQCFSYLLTECLVPAVCYSCSRWKACGLHTWI